MRENYRSAIERPSELRIVERAVKVVAGEEIVAKSADARQMKELAAPVGVAVEARGRGVVVREVDAREEGLERGIAIDEGSEDVGPILDERTK